MFQKTRNCHNKKRLRPESTFVMKGKPAAIFEELGVNVLHGFWFGYGPFDEVTHFAMSFVNCMLNSLVITFRVVEFLCILHYKYYYFNVFYIENGYKIIVEPFKYLGRLTTSAAKMGFLSFTRFSSTYFWYQNSLGFYSIPEEPNLRFRKLVTGKMV